MTAFSCHPAWADEKWETPALLILLAHYANNTAALQLSGWKIASIFRGQLVSSQPGSHLRRANVLLRWEKAQKTVWLISVFKEKLPGRPSKGWCVWIVPQGCTNVFNLGGVYSILNPFKILPIALPHSIVYVSQSCVITLTTKIKTNANIC